jgi:peptidoglycan/LPS O-acetylase OafA/YrhL
LPDDAPTLQADAPARVDALDGLRALAVTGVLAFHLGLRQARGGFLGVSLFFTLSGYLITSLLLAEHARTGRIDLLAFWRRRAARLLPAALAALALVVALAAAAGGPSQRRALGGDVLSALTGTANWHLVLAGHGYAALWDAPSPVQHSGSLAVAQQLYLVVPLLVAGALAVGRGRRRVLAVALVAGILASTAVGHAVAGDAARAYYGTDARAGELLIGALLAVLAASRPAWLRVPTPVALAALGAVVGSWAVVGEHDRGLFEGLLVAHAVLTATVIAALRQPSGAALARALAARPLQALGRISYGIYLFHWPLFLWLSPQRTGLPPLSLDALRLTATLALAAASHRLVERPFLTPESAGVRARRPRLRLLVTPAVAVVVVALLVTGVAPSPDLLVDATAASATTPVGPAHGAPPAAVPARTGPGATPDTGPVPEPATSSAPAPTASAASPAPAPSRLASSPPLPADDQSVGAAAADPALPPRTPLLPGERLRVYLAGDSTIYGLGTELAPYGRRTGDFDVWNAGAMACHVVRGGTYRWAADPPKETEAPCNGWEQIRSRHLADIRPHVTVVGFADVDLLDRRLPGDDRWLHLGDPAYDAVVRRELDAFATMLERSGTRTLWLTAPRLRSGILDHVAPVHDFPESDAARPARWNQLLAETAAHHPSVQVVDLRSWLRATLPDELDPDARPDGVHLTQPYTRAEASWLAPQIVRAPAG